MQERQAIIQLKQGDIGGLEVLVRIYQLRAVRAADLIVRDRALAEDIVQAAFLRAYERIGQFDAARPFGPWFLRSVVNDAIKATVRAGRQVSLEADAGADDGLRADLLADPSPALLDAVEMAETREAIWQALGTLSPAQRAVIVLRYYLEMGEAEMADALVCAPGTIKSRLNAARQRLRRRLRPFAPLSAERQEHGEADS